VEPGTATEHPLRCVECCLTITATAAGWRAYLIDLRDEGEPLEVVVLCPECAGREFDA
jgi:hypothetical protein